MTTITKDLSASLKALATLTANGTADLAMKYDHMHYVSGVTADMLAKPDTDAPAKVKGVYQAVEKAVAQGLAAVHGAGFITLLEAEKGQGKPMESAKAGYLKLITRTDAQRMVHGTIGAIRRNIASRDLEHATAKALLNKTDYALFLDCKRDPESIGGDRIKKIAFNEISTEIADATAAAKKAERDAKEAERLAKSVDNAKDAIKTIAADIRADAKGKYKMNPKIRATALEHLDWLSKNLS